MEVGIFHFAAGIREGGGKPVYSRKISQALADRCNVTLYTAEPAFERLHESDVEVVEIPKWPGDPLHRAISRKEPVRLRSVLSYLDARRDSLGEHISQQDLLFTHKWYEDLVVSRTAEPPVVYHRHAVGNHGIGGKSHEMFAAPEWTIANSEPTKRGLERTLGIDVDGVVRPGVDTEQFRPTIPPAFDADVPTILFAGRFEPVKGVETLLEAFEPLAGEARLVYIGDGSKRKTLERRSQELGISDAVEVNGVVPHEEIGRYYAAADVICHPSTYEGFGMTNLEAMASGTPLVTTPFGFVEEFGTPGETHLEVQPGSTDALQEALADLLGDAQRRTALGRKARNLAKQHTWDRRAEKLVTLCEEFLDEYE